MPGGTQTIQLGGQNIQNLQGLQVLPLSALQVGLSCIVTGCSFYSNVDYRMQEDSKLLYSNLSKLKSCKQVMAKL